MVMFPASKGFPMQRHPSVNIGGGRHNLPPPGKVSVMQPYLAQVARRQDLVPRRDQFRRARRKIVCFSIYGSLPRLKREQSCRLWSGSTEAPSWAAAVTHPVMGLPNKG